MIPYLAITYIPFNIIAHAKTLKNTRAKNNNQNNKKALGVFASLREAKIFSSF
jgi:hypothetical protein